jgi:6-phosphogluconolactonase/glucosamine-6-phosphate isomerase/deaminase
MQLEVVSADSPTAAGEYAAGLIAGQLAQSRTVLWLLSGGSAMEVAVAAAQVLEGENLSGLMVSLIDERYGQVGHADSNWHQLSAAGFRLTGATLHPVLTGAPAAQTASDYEAWLRAQFDIADFRLGLLGIGGDGHTAGILPHSPAVTAPGLVYAYAGPDYQRITLTGRALARLSEAVVYVAGQSKWPLLDQLETVLDPADQPAQLLKAVPRLTLYTDRPA